MKSVKGVLILTALAVMTLSVTAWAATPKKSGTDFAKSQTAVNAGDCLECHETVGMLYDRGNHKDINCISCHNDLPAHMADNSRRPGTDMSWDACGTCHSIEMDTMLKVEYHRPARDDKSQPGNRIPVWYDKLMAPHGFTKEHALTRPHALMLLDQFIVDRAFGGRFQPKNGWEYVLETGKVWDIIEDVAPTEPGQKRFLPQTATAANPVCISCKTADHILDWAFLGEPGQGAPWDRSSDVVAMAKSVDHSLNCFFCHDPHSAEPRIIRDALIDALETPDMDNVWHSDPNRTGIEVIEMGERGYTRKIAILAKPDTRLMCAQCHVEYNCNPGTNPVTGESIGFASPLTNHFPLKDVLHLYDHYFVKLQFADFKNMFDGAWLWKGQHPEFETYYQSVHSQLGVGCADCHMPTIKNKSGKVQYTDHFAQTPRHIMKETCLTANCHPSWTEDEGIYVIDSIKAYTKSRMRKAEFWLSTLIDAVREAEAAGVDPEILREARVAHTKSHILWEYWTAENSDGFHNPELARESLAQSIDISSEAVNMLYKAMADKRASAGR